MNPSFVLCSIDRFEVAHGKFRKLGLKEVVVFCQAYLENRGPRFFVLKDEEVSEKKLHQ